MLIKEIVKKINQLVSNNTSFKLDYERLRLYLDGAVDHINTELLTEYSTIQELFEKFRGYYSVLYKSNIAPVMLSNTAPNLDGYWFNENEHRLMQHHIVMEAALPAYPYVYVIENMMLYECLPDGSYLPKSYSMLDKVPDDMNYDEFPDRYIRSCLCYYASALYLEEEDELESQYAAYKSKAAAEIAKWKQQYYSMYECRW